MGVGSSIIHSESVIWDSSPGSCGRTPVCRRQRIVEEAAVRIDQEVLSRSRRPCDLLGLAQGNGRLSCLCRGGTAPIAAMLWPLVRAQRSSKLGLRGFAQAADRAGVRRWTVVVAELSYASFAWSLVLAPHVGSAYC